MSTRKKIISLLESNRERHLSGESIARQIGVTRNAVWKVIKELEKDGYKIEAVTNKGYALSSDSDILSAEGILPFLTEDICDSIFVYESLESTNKTAKEMAVAGAKHGTIVIANGQTAGRGRYDRKFYSPAGNGLYMSMILRPSRLWLSTPTLVTLFAAVCVCEAIEMTTGKQPQIKWVNDIFVNGKKVCGILTEAVTDFESGGIGWIVVGVGVNISSEGYPDEIKHIAGAIFTNDEPTITRNRLAAEIINRIMLPNATSEKELIDHYKKRLFILEQTIMVNSVDQPYEARVIDVDVMGQLVVEKDSGEVVKLSSGEISIIVNL